jgi:hypothetical protein
MTRATHSPWSSDPLWFSASQVVAMLCRKDISSRVIERLLAKIQQLNPTLNAVVGL